MSDELLQIGAFSKMADTSLRTLRYYEELGLIRPTRRSEGKFRYYAKDQVKRVASIKRLQSLGLSLEEIQEIMVPAPSDVSGAVERLRDGLDKQIALVTTRLESLQAELGELRQARTKLEECGPCPHEIGSSACDACALQSPLAVAVLRSLV